MPVLLVDLKERSDNDRAALLESVLEELAKDLGFFARVGLVEQERVPGILSLVQFSYRGDPAHLMPLAEISRSDDTDPNAVQTLVASLESIGKVPVVCSASPGYIVPRIQSLAMGEAARLVEEGVASAEDVDKAINVDFGLRFSVLGLLEFIDWGGGDIMHYACKYLSENIGSRYEAPAIIGENMHSNKNGLRDGEGFFDYKNVDIDAYREQRMLDFVAQLKHKKLLPQFKSADESQAG